METQAKVDLPHVKALLDLIERPVIVVTEDRVVACNTLATASLKLPKVPFDLERLGKLGHPIPGKKNRSDTHFWSDETPKGTETAVYSLKAVPSSATPAESTTADWASVFSTPQPPSTQLLLNALRSILTNLPDTVIILDDKQRLLCCNCSVERLEKIKKPTIKNLVGLLNWSPTQYEHFRSDIDFLTHSKRSIIRRNDDPVYDLQGEVIHTTSTFLRVPREDGSTAAIVCVIIDETDRRKKLEQMHAAVEVAEANDRTKTEFMLNMRHDISAPLTGIVGLAKLAREQNQADVIEPYLKSIVQSSSQLVEFISEILNLKNIEAGRLPAINRPISLKNELEQLQQIFATRVKEKNLKFKITFDDSISGHLVTDHLRLHRIMINLIGNAVKYTHKGFVRVEMKKLQDGEREEHIQISIVDSGIGIPADKLDAVFERYMRVKNSTQHKYEGLGLGLNIVKTLVDDLNGTITVSSKRGKGTTFSVVIPFLKPEQRSLQPSLDGEENGKVVPMARMAPVKTPQPLPTVEAEGHQRISLLIIEDNDVARFIAQSVVEKLSTLFHSAQYAVDAADAWSKLSQDQFDLVLMDIGLPDKEGDVLARELRDNMNLQSPIYALTAHGAEDISARIQGSGINGTLEKPLTEAKLYELCKSHFAVNPDLSFD